MIPIEKTKADYLLTMSQEFKRQQVKDWQSYISIFVVYITFPNSCYEQIQPGNSYSNPFYHIRINPLMPAFSCRFV